MKKVIYEKLVRDGVPEFLTKIGKAFEIREMEDDELFERELLRKVIEEAEELSIAKGRDSVIQEIGDLLEVIDALKARNGITDAEATAAKTDRAMARGGFSKRIMLLWSEDDGYEAGKAGA